MFIAALNTLLPDYDPQVLKHVAIYVKCFFNETICVNCLAVGTQCNISWLSSYLHTHLSSVNFNIASKTSPSTLPIKI